MCSGRHNGLAVHCRLFLLLLALIVWPGLTVAAAIPAQAQAAPSAIAPVLASNRQSNAHKPAALKATAANRDTLPDDLAALFKRGSLRVVVVYDKTQYFVESGRPQGVTSDALKQFEVFLNRNFRHRYGHSIKLDIRVARPDELLPKLLAGEADLVAADVIMTPENRQQVAFSLPLSTRVDDVLVTGPAAPEIKVWGELSARQLLVRRQQPYYAHLQELNHSLASQGKAPILLREAPPYLEDEDLLEMANSGLVPYVVTERHLASLWARVFRNLKVRDDLAVHRGARVAWAFRKGSPELADAVDAFIVRFRESPKPADDLVARYRRSDRWVKPALADADVARFDKLYPLFEKYGKAYQIDPLWLAAVAYQESGLDPQADGGAGPVGIMQMLPATARGLKSGNIHQAEGGIKAGAKYLRQMIDQNFAEPGIDDLNRMLFAVASYNTGPNAVVKLRARAKAEGRKADIWFDEVERTVISRVGGQIPRYVDNVYKYYLAYSWLQQRRLRGTTN